MNGANQAGKFIKSRQIPISQFQKLEVVSSRIFIFFRRNRTVRYSKRYTQTYTHSNSNNLAV